MHLPFLCVANLSAPSLQRSASHEKQFTILIMLIVAQALSKLTGQQVLTYPGAVQLSFLCVAHLSVSAPGYRPPIPSGPRPFLTPMPQGSTGTLGLLSAPPLQR